MITLAMVITINIYALVINTHDLPVLPFHVISDRIQSNATYLTSRKQLISLYFGANVLQEYSTRHLLKVLQEFRFLQFYNKIK